MFTMREYDTVIQRVVRHGSAVMKVQMEWNEHSGGRGITSDGEKGRLPEEVELSESAQSPHPCFRRAKVMDLHIPSGWGRRREQMRGDKIPTIVSFPSTSGAAVPIINHF